MTTWERLAEIQGDWIPTAANINALPDPVRRLIHDLETAGIGTSDTRARIELEALTLQLQAEMVTLTKERDRLQAHHARLTDLLVHTTEQLHAARGAFDARIEPCWEANRHLSEQLSTATQERDRLQAENEQRRQAQECEICRDCNSVKGSTASICDDHYGTACQALADEQDDNARLQAEHARLTAAMKEILHLALSAEGKVEP